VTAVDGERIEQGDQEILISLFNLLFVKGSAWCSTALSHACRAGDAQREKASSFELAFVCYGEGGATGNLCRPRPLSEG
jgi:hypothetical protein